MLEALEGFAIYIGAKAAAIISGAFGAAVSMAVIKGPLWYRFVLFGGGLVTATGGIYI